MAERTHKQRRHGGEGAPDVADESQRPQGAGGGRLKADLDDLLDEIDEVLEENAEEFVKGYVQKGGE